MPLVLDPAIVAQVSRCLEAGGMTFTVTNHGHHFVIDHDGTTLDLWPKNDRWRDRAGKGPVRTSGLMGLLGYLRSRAAEKRIMAKRGVDGPNIVTHN